jgi:hypothetical protein
MTTVWIIKDKENTFWLIGKAWMEKGRDGIVLNDKGKMMIEWIKNGYDKMPATRPNPKTLLKWARDEIGAQESYREFLRSGIMSVVGRLRDMCKKRMDELVIPRHANEQYVYGYNTGKYETYAEVAQMIQYVVDQANIVLDDKREITNDKTDE